MITIHYYKHKWVMHYYLLFLIHLPVKQTNKQTNKLFVPTCTRMCVCTNCGSKISLFSLCFPVLILHFTRTCTCISLNLSVTIMYIMYTPSLPLFPPSLSLSHTHCPPSTLLSLPTPPTSPLPLLLYFSLSYQWLLVTSMSMRDSLASFTCTRNSSIRSRDSLKWVGVPDHVNHTHLYCRF